MTNRLILFYKKILSFYLFKYKLTLNQLIPLDISDYKKEKKLTPFKGICSICSILLLLDGRIAIVSNQGRISIYNLSTLERETTFLGSNGDTTALCQLKNGLLISSIGKENVDVTIWDIFSKEHKVHVYSKAHVNEVTKIIEVDNFRIATASIDMTIKIWSAVSPFVLLFTFIGHSYWVEDIMMVSYDMMVSGSDDKTLRFWNILTYQSEGVIKDVDCCSHNSISKINSEKIFIGGYLQFSIVNVISCTVELQIKNQALMNVYQFIDDSKEKIYFRSENSIASYDIGTKKINRTKSYEKQMNCIIRIDDYTFMSKCQDSVVIWKKINNNQRNNICLSTLE